MTAQQDNPARTSRAAWLALVSRAHAMGQGRYSQVMAMRSTQAASSPESMAASPLGARDSDTPTSLLPLARDVTTSDHRPCRIK